MLRSTQTESPERIVIAVCKRFCESAESTEQYCDAYTFQLGEHTLCVGKTRG